MTDLDTIEAHIAVGLVKARYCRTLDTRDREGHTALFTDDLVLDTRPAGGTLVRERCIRQTAAGESPGHGLHGCS